MGRPQCRSLSDITIIADDGRTDDLEPCDEDEDPGDRDPRPSLQLAKLRGHAQASVLSESMTISVWLFSTWPYL